ncbi:MAG: DUF2326 domain-containing protein [Planctomycetes bacterium]|nr:DUF2326 domain-containing protein [Planctomycetota bacterium]
MYLELANRRNAHKEVNPLAAGFALGWHILVLVVYAPVRDGVFLLSDTLDAVITLEVTAEQIDVFGPDFDGHGKTGVDDQRPSPRKRMLIGPAKQRIGGKCGAKEINNVVEELDQSIAELNNERYLLSRTRKRLVDSLQAEQIQFRPEAASKLFEEAGVVFPGQVVKQFEDLVRFNKEISEERIGFLKEELVGVNGRLGEVAKRLETLNRLRQVELQFLGDTESVSKYRELNQRLVVMKNDLASMERQRDALLGIRERDKKLRAVIREREDQVEALQANIDTCGANKDSRYERVRAALVGLCEGFLRHKALITTRLNKKGNIEFDAEYLDASDIPTSEAEGKSYKQALCAAYDLAVAQVLLDEDFIRFVYLDGLLEGMDNRIKFNMIDVLRKLADQGIQQILTVIDSDLPLDEDGEKFFFDDDEIILTLHDEGAEGRLFRMETW